jgi:hypothetical protein
VTGSTAKDADIGGWRQGQRNPELAVVPNKEDGIIKVGSISTTKIIGHLAVVLWRQQPKGARRYKIGVRNCEGPTMAGIIQDGPPNGANLGGTRGSIEPLYTNDLGSNGWCQLVCQVVGDAGGCPTIHKDVE